MKVHFIISSLNGGGAERVLTIMANSLVDSLNYDVSIITLFNSKSEYELSNKIKHNNLKKTNITPSHTFNSIIGLSRLYSKKRNRPDIIISFITLTNQISLIVAKLFSIKIIVQEHNSHHRFMKGRKFSTIFTKKYLYRMANLVTVLTSYDIPYYQQFGINVKVLPNPCSYKPIVINTHKRDKVILAVGDLNRYHHKGFDNLLNFITPILKENPDWKLKIAGSGNEGLKTLEKIVEKQDLSNQVIFLGFVKNISELMFKSSIFILPSRFEGLPMVLLEAMSQGLACIAYNCVTGPSDIITNNRNGLLIENQNQQEMQLELNRLIKDSDLRNKLSSEGILSLKKYHIDTITNQYQKLIQDIVSS